MSDGFADVEHIWAGPMLVPEKLRKLFPDGVVVVFADEVYVAAIPATREEAIQLIGLFEDGDRGYFLMRDKLCGEFSYNQLSLLYKLEMEKVQGEEAQVDDYEFRLAQSKYVRLASAYRPKGVELN